MSAYTETNFNACLDAISAIRSHRDMAIRIADGLLRVTEEDYHDQMCDCDRCALKTQLDNLKVNVITYQKGMQKKQP